MKLVRALFLVPFCTALAGCAYFDSYFTVDRLNKAQPQGSVFSQELTAQYRERANQSQELYNYEQASRVANRGLAAAQGTEVEPYNLNGWQLPQDKVSELTVARQRLQEAFDRDAREKAPKETAQAQARLDCWIEDSIKTWNPDQFQTCRQDFLNAIENVEAAVGKSPISPADAVVGNSANYYIFFDSGKASLTAEARRSIATFAKDILQRSPSRVMVYGYTDKPGSKKANLRMSQKRAASVAEALIKQGVSGDLIKVVGKGSADPLVPSKKSEPSNRRVEIIVE